MLWLKATGLLDYLFIRRRPNSNSLLQQPIKQFPSILRCSTIEPKCVFVEVIVEMLMTNSSLMCGHQPAFQQTGHPVTRGQQVIAYISQVLYDFVA